MREKLPQRWERCRLTKHAIMGDVSSEGMTGMFDVMGPLGKRLRVLSSIDDVVDGGTGWEHVSVSAQKRTPTWEEMCFVKDAFWEPEEAVFQLHPPRSMWVNNHPFVLHMWRKPGNEIALPPLIFVGVKDDGTYKNMREAAEGYKRMKLKGEV